MLSMPLTGSSVVASVVVVDSVVVAVDDSVSAVVVTVSTVAVAVSAVSIVFISVVAIVVGSTLVVVGRNIAVVDLEKDSRDSVGCVEKVCSSPMSAMLSVGCIGSSVVVVDVFVVVNSVNAVVCISLFDSVVFISAVVDSEEAEVVVVS